MFSTKTAMISLMALAAAAPAFAQPQPYRDPAAQAEYDRQMDNYNRQQDAYRNQRQSYDARRDAYADQTADYQRQRDQYFRHKADYDRRYGVGAYDRRYPEYATRYAAAPYAPPLAAQTSWDRDRDAYYRDRDDYDRRNGRGAFDRRYPAYSQRFATAPISQYDRERDDYYRLRADYDRRNGIGAYDRRYPNFAERYGMNASATVPAAATYAQPCDLDARRQTSTTTGGIIGALAGAALGGSVAANGAKTEGAVLGAVLGGVVGGTVGRASAKCDTTGYYYTYDQTMPYREDSADRYGRSGQYDYAYYERQGCRLVTAPADVNGRTDTRYVRVCPDNQGRYRITG